MNVNINISIDKVIKNIKVDVLLLLIICFGAFLRFFMLDFQEPWLDEISTFQVTDPTLTFKESNWLIMNRDGFPHLYFLSIKYLSAIFGHSVFLLRFFSAFFGTLTIYYVFKLFKELFNKNYGYIGAILLTVNYFHIFHSQEARAYTLLAFFIVFATYKTIVFIKESNYRNAVILGIAIGLIPNAHPLGFLNVAILFSTMGMVFLTTGKLKENIKYLFVVLGIILLCSLPLLPKLLVLSSIQSFWIPEANYENIKNAFFELTGSINSIFYIYAFVLIISLIAALVFVLKRINYSKKSEAIALNYLVLFWFTINIGVIVVKSYMSISIILNRYFTGALVLFLLALVYCLYLLKNKWLNIILTTYIVIHSLWFLIYEKKYYTTVTKTQFVQLSQEIINNYRDGENVYSAYGFVTNILFKDSPCYQNMREITFDDYLTNIRNNPKDKEPFWYFDGNFRPYSLTVDNQLFLEQNYDMDHQIERLDCWARHYVVKGSQGKIPEAKTLSLKDFPNIKIEGDNMHYMFQNASIRSKILTLKKGKYVLEIEALSFPEVPINNENAIMEVKLNDQKLWKGQLSSNKKFTPIVLNFEVKDDVPKIISLSFVNDVAVNDKDRNMAIKRVELKKL